ncbi:hypothetical protein QSV08_03290 [Maribacter sp. BPC-D8]|uniref:hypothetical protein n=1 Tax=Maribacter sp. BPC-D8 TaxID=3053613 RepID=UPI002B469EB9|nr:hypothetical protein [Maribacter sp. BPC-D8]WRI30268.1 hypothetical protein QSV08_03290 [Maribacter sp. BPC-D8]
MKKTKQLLLITLLISFNSCQAQKTNDTELISTITERLGVRIGVKKGSELKFYDEKDNTFYEAPEMKFNVPNGTDEIIMAGSLLIVRNNSDLRFYQEINYDMEYFGYGFIELPEKNFSLPNRVDEIAMPYGIGLLCVRNGSELRFYKEEDYEFKKINYEFKELPEMKFNLPNEVDEIAMSGTVIFVRNGSELKVYSSKDKTLKELPEMKFKLPKGTDEIIMTPTGLLGVRVGSELRFYDAKTPSYTELTEMKFNLPKN